MPNATLRPSGTVANAWTVTGAATAHEAVYDAVMQPVAIDPLAANTGPDKTVDLSWIASSGATLTVSQIRSLS